jgi:hypothetical protein
LFIPVTLITANMHSVKQDFNGDGFNDIIVGVPSASVAYLFFGGNTIPSVPSVKFIGKPSTAFSEICRFAGDVNNDGYADIIFGVLTEVVRETYLVFGGPSIPSTYSVTEINPRTIKYAPDASNFYNSRVCGGVAGVGDTTKDGFDDFVICAYSQDLGSLINAGACYLIYGATNLQSISMRDLGSGGIRIYGTESNQNFGHVVAAAGDINGDGYADFFIQNGNREYVFLIYGGASLPSSFSTTVDSSFPGVIFPNPNDFSFFGSSIARAGDFNADGFDDIAISCSGWFSLSATVYVVYGGSSLPTIFDLNTLTSAEFVISLLLQLLLVGRPCLVEWILIWMGLTISSLVLSMPTIIMVLLMWSLDRFLLQSKPVCFNWETAALP